MTERETELRRRLEAKRARGQIQASSLLRAGGDDLEAAVRAKADRGDIVAKEVLRHLPAVGD